MQANTTFQIGQIARLRIDILPSEGFSAGTQVRIMGIENHQPRVAGECPQQADTQDENLKFLRTFYVVEFQYMGTISEAVNVNSCKIHHEMVATNPPVGRKAAASLDFYDDGDSGYLGEQMVVKQTPRPVTLRPGTPILIRSGPTTARGGKCRKVEEAFYQFQYMSERPKLIRRSLGCLVHGRDLILHN